VGTEGGINCTHGNQGVEGSMGVKEWEVLKEGGHAWRKQARLRVESETSSENLPHTSSEIIIYREHSYLPCNSHHCKEMVTQPLWLSILDHCKGLILIIQNIIYHLILFCSITYLESIKLQSSGVVFVKCDLNV
jgi:hypothetical protein